MARKSKLNFRKIFMSLISVIIGISFLIYFAKELYTQQITLAQQDKDKKYYIAQREQLEKEQKELEKQTSKIDSNEYIESIAREKLNMYYPNERIYLDSSRQP